MTTESENQANFSAILQSFKKTLKSIYQEKDAVEKFTQKRGFPKAVLDDIMVHNPLSVAIPKKYGGRGAKVSECLGILEAASYESLPLSLTFGINMALFLQPIAKYAPDSIKAGIFNRFLTQQNMGGLMITEPGYGSDALNMKTSHTKKDTAYHIKGVKHWQGLTGMADYWLITSRHKSENGSLARDIDFFICDTHQSEQQIKVEEYYNALGLYAIPYGKNCIDIEVPQQHKLVPETSGLKLMMDLLHRSRLQFPGMAIGFIHRMLDEAIKQCQTRIVGGKALLSLDKVKGQISKIQSAFTICSAMCLRSSAYSSIDNDLSLAMVEANCMKAYATDLMQYSTQTTTQLCGANGYKTESISARGIVDSRPFRIFEGSNEMLYTQISETVVKMMTRKKVLNLFEFLKTYELTNNAASYFKNKLNFNIEAGLPQRKMVALGKIISRVVSADSVIILGSKGFRTELINNCMDNIRHEIAVMVSSYNNQTTVSPIADYHDKSSWLVLS